MRPGASLAVLLTASTGCAMTVLDTNVVAVVLPTIARACAGLLIAKTQFNGIGGSQTYISLTPNSVVSALRFLWRGGL